MSADDSPFVMKGRRYCGHSPLSLNEMLERLGHTPFDHMLESRAHHPMAYDHAVSKAMASYDSLEESLDEEERRLLVRVFDRRGDAGYIYGEYKFVLGLILGAELQAHETWPEDVGAVEISDSLLTASQATDREHFVPREPPGPVDELTMTKRPGC